MFRINPNCLYSKADLAEALEGLMSLDTFLLRLPKGYRKPFKAAYWGADLIAAINAIDVSDGPANGRTSVSTTRRTRARSGSGNLIDLDEFA